VGTDSWLVAWGFIIDCLAGARSLALAQSQAFAESHDLITPSVNAKVRAYSLNLAGSFIEIDLTIWLSQACCVWRRVLAGLYLGFVVTVLHLVRTDVEFCAGQLSKVLLVVSAIGIL
jgi:hypothetical protein